MKHLLLLLLTASSLMVHAQNAEVKQLPAGTYQVQASQNSIFKGDIILMDGSKYKLSTDNAVGDYKFSATAQRVLFLNGPLKGAFARAVMNGTEPAIMLPRKENEDLGLKLVTQDLQASFKKN